MPKRLVLENEFVHMWFYPETGIVHHQFRKFIWGDAFREVLNEGLKVFAREGATKWLSDDRESSALSKADTDWSMSDWFPRISALGWKYWAIVLPQSVLGEMNIKRFINAYTEQGLTVQVFDDPVPALAWLESVAQKPAVVAAEHLRQATVSASRVAASLQPAHGSKTQPAASLQPTSGVKAGPAVTLQPTSGNQHQIASRKRQS